MLNKRQIDIIKYFEEHSNQSFTVEELAQEFLFSTRTIINDLHQINNFLLDNGVQIRKKEQRYILDILNKKKHIQLIKHLLDIQSEYHFNDQASRIDYMIFRFTNSHGYIRLSMFENEMYISKSTVSADMKHVKDYFATWNLSLYHKPHHGMCLCGTEQDKRFALSNRNIFLYITNHFKQDITHETSKIREILATVLLKYKIRISDIEFQNVVIQILTSIVRNQNGFCLENTECLCSIFDHALSAASEIYNACTKLYNVPIHNEEIKSLAISLQCKREYDDCSYISDEVNKFIFGVLVSIREKYGLDFTSELDLRMSLALHTVPLLVRVLHGKTLVNFMTIEIRRQFTLQFDLANEYAYHFNNAYQFKLSDDEISYIALHFINAVEKIDTSKSSLSFLLISEQRKSATILIQQQLIQWFKDRVNSIYVINKSEVDIHSLDKFDVVLTTDEAILDMVPIAVRINFFPVDKDFQRINFAINGISSAEDILSFFDPRLFFFGTVKNKQEMIKILTSQAVAIHKSNDLLFQSCIHHESITNTYFGNGTAMPHPNQLVTDESFICIGRPKQSITWDDREVNLVLLVSVSRKEPRALQIWKFLSLLISEKEVIKEICASTNYQDCMTVISSFYRTVFNQ